MSDSEKAVVETLMPVASGTVVEEVLEDFRGQRSDLIPILQEVQARLGFLSAEAMEAIAAGLGLSATDVYGVATFYTQFRFTAPGRRCLKICDGTACHVRGSEQLLQTIARVLGIHPGETTADRHFSLERMMCLGSCALAPALVVDDVVYGRINRQRLEKLLAETRAEEEAHGVTAS